MRVLLVQTGHLGDLVLTTPIVRTLVRHDPDSRVTVLTTPLGEELLGGFPGVEAVWTIDKSEADGRARRTAILARRLVSGGFDVALAPHRSFRSGLFVALSRAPLRVGYRGAQGQWAYRRRVVYDLGRHAVERYLALLEPLGIRPHEADRQPRLDVDPSARATVESWLTEHGGAAGDGWVALAPGSVWGTKRWRPEGFADVTRAVRERGMRPVLIGSGDEAELCREVARLSAASPAILAGRTGLAELTALLARVAALVVNDSGPAHVAAAVGTPVVTVFGPTAPAYGYTPLGVPCRVVEHPDLECRPCDHHGPHRCPLEHFRCMREIPSHRVVSALDEVLEGAGRS